MIRALLLLALVGSGCDRVAKTYPGPWSTAETEQARADNCYRKSEEMKKTAAQYPNWSGPRGMDNICDGIAQGAEKLRVDRQAKAEKLRADSQAKYEEDCRSKGLRFVGTIGDQVECRP